MSRWALALVGMIVFVGCASAHPLEQRGQLLAEHTQISHQMKEAVLDGAHDPNCAPKASALAEANLEFAATDIEDHKFERAHEHLDIARHWTERAKEQTTPDCPFRCTLPGPRLSAHDADGDGDGYVDSVDSCPELREDFDAFEDDDGCPDRDNDQDGILDASVFEDGEWINLDRKGDLDCRFDPEDFDGFEDDDGCPDLDPEYEG